MRVGIFVLIVFSAGLVGADVNSTTAPGIVPPAASAHQVEKLAELNLSAASMVRPDQPRPEGIPANKPMAKSENPKYYIDGHAEFDPIRHVTERDLTKDISLDEIDVYGFTLSDFCTGLDYGSHSTGPVIICSSSEDDTIYFLDLETLVFEDSWSVDPTNTNVFGNFVGGGVYTNDWSNTNIFFTGDAGSSWSTTANPAGNSGRGMDWDSSYTNLVWQAHSDTGSEIYSLVSFSRGSTTGTFHDVSEYIPGQISGLAVFDAEGRTGIAVTCYNTDQMYFFDYNGSSLIFLGSRTLPWSPFIDLSFGLGYSSSNGLFYWSFRSTNGIGYISKFRVDLRAIFQDGFENGHIADWSCNGQCCGEYTFDCNPDNPCACLTSTEGEGVCTDGGACDPAMACISSADCRPGFFCATCTCCGFDLCARRQCGAFAPPEPFQQESMTMTGW